MMESEISPAQSCLFSTSNGARTEWKRGSYVRRIMGIEHLYERTMKYHSENTIQAVWLQSTSQIHAEQVTEALQHLMRKYAIFQLCLGKRGGSIWIRVMDEPIMNFDAVHDDPIQVFHSMIRYEYDFFNGPLWKACLVYPSASTKEAVLIFSLYHMITDAYTNTILQNELVQTLNKIMRNETAETSVCSLNGMLVQDGNLSFRKYGKLFSKVALKQITRAYTHVFPYPSFVIDSLQRKELVDPTTKVFTGTLNRQQTKDLFALCKSHGVTVNSCVVSACSHALVKTAEAKGPSSKKAHEIVVSHAVDLRKYYKPENASSIGPHVSIIQTGCHIPTSQYSSVWESAKTLNTEAQKKISAKVPLKYVSFFKSYAQVLGVADLKVRLKKPPMVDHHFMSTNMGNLDKLLPESGPDDAVRITDIMRCTNREYGCALFNLAFHTFRGELKYSLDCFSTKLTHKDSVALFDNVRETLHTLAKAT